MKNLKLLNNFVFQIFIIFFFLTQLLATEPVDIWKSNDELEKEPTQEEKIILESKKNLLFESDENSNIEVAQEEEKNLKFKKVYGLFDPEENNLSLDMWKEADGQRLLRILDGLKKRNLSNDSENLFIKTLFTISYLPDQNIKPHVFLNYKLEWLIDKKKINIIEDFLEKNPDFENNSSLLKFLIEEYLSNANISKACEKHENFYKKSTSLYLDKIKIYCLIKKNKIEEAQLQYDLLKDRGFEDKFYDGKINYLLGYSEKPDLKISDKDLFNLHLSHIVNKNFKYEPTSKTKKYIWRYLSSNNLHSNTESMDLSDEEAINLYERAAAQNTYNKGELFDIYKKFLFNINQFLNAEQVYKSLPTYKARALIYQSALISEDLQRKFNLLVLLNDLFKKDDIENALSEEMLSIVKEIDRDKIPENYFDFYQHVIDSSSSKQVIIDSSSSKQVIKKIKYDNKIIHKSKLLKYFIDDEYDSDKISDDLNSIYKKVKKNKKYFFSLKDIILLESLKADGIEIPQKLAKLYSIDKLTIPTDLIILSSNQETGMTLLRIVEIIGEDNLEDLDLETLFFITAILNKLNLKKIRNNIIIKTLPSRV